MLSLPSVCLALISATKATLLSFVSQTITMEEIKETTANM